MFGITSVDAATGCCCCCCCCCSWCKTPVSDACRAQVTTFIGVLDRPACLSCRRRASVSCNVVKRSASWTALSVSQGGQRSAVTHQVERQWVSWWRVTSLPMWQRYQSPCCSLRSLASSNQVRYHATTYTAFIGLSFPFANIMSAAAVFGLKRLS